MQIPEKDFHDTGEILRETYRQNGQHHRTDGPAVIWYYKTGQISAEHYVVLGELHRDKGPAEIWYTQDGSIQREFYYIRGKLHREDGPAEISQGPNCYPKKVFNFYKNGIKLNIAAFKGTINPTTGDILDQDSFDLIYSML